MFALTSAVLLAATLGFLVYDRAVAGDPSRGAPNRPGDAFPTMDPVQHAATLQALLRARDRFGA